LLTPSEPLTVAAVLLSAGGGAAVDLHTRRVPNRLTLGAALLGLAAAILGLGAMSPASALLGFVVGLVLMLPGHLFGGTGGGDVKLMAALGMWLGAPLIVKAFLYSAIAGGLITLVVATRRGRVGATFAGAARLVSSPASARREVGAADRDNRFPYAPAIAAGSALAVLGF